MANMGPATPAGLLNPASPWQRLVHGGRAVCCNKVTGLYAVESAEHGVEREIDALGSGLTLEKFEAACAHAQKKQAMTRAGLLNAASNWIKVSSCNMTAEYCCDAGSFQLDDLLIPVILRSFVLKVYDHDRAIYVEVSPSPSDETVIQQTNSEESCALELPDSADGLQDQVPAVVSHSYDHWLHTRPAGLGNST